MTTGTRDNWVVFDEESLWQEPAKSGLWDEVVGTLVVVALLAVGAALMLAG